MSVSDDLRAAIENSGLSLRDLSCEVEKVTDESIDSSQLSRFMNGKRWLGEGSVDALCKFFGLRLVKSRKR